MDEMFSFLSDCMPVGNQRYIEKLVSVGLLPSVECIPALIACMAMDSASSTNSFASAIFCGGSLCNNVLRTFPTV